MNLDLHYLAPAGAPEPHAAIAAAIRAVLAINSHQPSDDELRELLDQVGSSSGPAAVARLRELSTSTKEPS